MEVWGVGVQRPVLRVNDPRKTGARSARARSLARPTSFQYVRILMCDIGFGLNTLNLNPEIGKQLVTGHLLSFFLAVLTI